MGAPVNAAPSRQHLRAYYWKPGNPAGRKVGSRAKFAKDFIEHYYEIWQEEGKEALRQCAKKKHDKFIMVAAHLLPQHFKLEHEHKLTRLSDEELKQKVLEALEELARAGITIGLDATEIAALPAPNGGAEKIDPPTPPNRKRISATVTPALRAGRSERVTMG